MKASEKSVPTPPKSDGFLEMGKIWCTELCKMHMLLKKCTITSLGSQQMAPPTMQHTEPSMNGRLKWETVFALVDQMQVGRSRIYDPSEDAPTPLCI